MSFMDPIKVRFTDLQSRESLEFLVDEPKDPHEAQDRAFEMLKKHPKDISHWQQLLVEFVGPPEHPIQVMIRELKKR